MPNLNSITNMINVTLKSGNFKGMKFQSSDWNGISDPVETDKGEGNVIMQPMIVDDQGECKMLVFDDVFNMVVFHKVEGLDYEVADPNYGKPGTTIQETAQMKMIFSADRSKLLIRPEDMIAAAVMDIPKEFLPTDISPLGLNSCVIEMGSVNKDPYSVWEENWKGVKFPLSPEDLLFSISYKIVSTFNKCCFSFCQ